LRVISLAPSLTEILFALGLEKNLVGVTEYCDYPPQAQEKPGVGSFMQPNLERILELQPHILLTVNPVPSSVAFVLEQSGIQILQLAQSRLQDLFPAIQRLGELFNATGSAQNLSQDLERRLDSVRRIYADIPLGKRPRVFVEIWHNPLTVPGRDSFITDLVLAAGAVSVTGQMPGDYLTLSQDAVVAMDPEWIIVAEMGESKPTLDALRSRLGWQEIHAVREGNILSDLDPSFFLRPGPRLVEGVETLYRRLHGEAS